MSKPTRTPADIASYNGLADVLGRPHRKSRKKPGNGKGDGRRDFDPDHCTRQQFEETWDQIDWSR